MRENLWRFSIAAICIAAVLCFSPCAHAKVEWGVVLDIPLEDTPLDIAMSRDGATAYILCEQSIVIYSTREQQVTDTLQVTDGFSQLVLSPDEQFLFLTNPAKKQVSIVQLSEVFQLEIGNSPVIGKADAPINIFVFFDFQ